MKKIFISPINYLLLFDDNIKVINVEKPSLYRLLSINILDNMTYSIDDKTEQLDKKSLIIYNPFEIDINDPKNVKNLLKKIEIEIRNLDYQLLNEIEVKILDLLEIATENLDIPIDYNMNVDIQKLLSAFNLVYKEPLTYIEKLIYYIKIHSEINKITLIITFGLLNLLETDEIGFLDKELKKLNLHLLDINYSSKNHNKDILVDEDWCVI